MTAPLVVGTGLIALDLILSPDGSVRQCAGGTAGNVLSILAYLGWRSLPVARLGKDHAAASIQADFEKWGVDVSLLRVAPQAPTPVIVERVLKNPRGEDTHRFSPMCPWCGSWLPRYSPVGVRSSPQVLSDVPVPAVFFFDRPSPGSVALAEGFAASGALVVFEPSGAGDRRSLGSALAIADVVKYSDQRLAGLPAHSSSRDRRLEIQTLGARGLRFRWSGGRRAEAWRSLPAISAGKVLDTAGAGDWCTAGLLAKVGGGAHQGFAALGDGEVEEALRYGQALAAWNCRFEGARGGMYLRSQREFAREVRSLLKDSETHGA